MPRTAELLFGTGRVPLRLPEHAVVLRGPEIPRAAAPEAAVRAALRQPVGAAPLREVAQAKQPDSVCITMSDITRPVPNELLITAILEELNAVGIRDSSCTVLIATGMQWLLFLPAVWLVGPTLGFGMLAIWIAQIVYRQLQTLAFVAEFRRGRWKRLEL